MPEDLPDLKRAAALLIDLLPRLVTRTGSTRRLFDGMPLFRRPVLTVPVTPWYASAVGLFSIVIGLSAAARNKFRVQFLFDDIPYPAEDRTFKTELNSLNDVLKLLAPDFDTVRLTEQSPEIGAYDAPALRQIVCNAVAVDIEHRLGNKALGEEHVDEFRRLAESSLFLRASRLLPVLKRSRRGAILVPGGLVNGSWIYTGLAAHLHLRCATFDSGPGALLIDSRGIAAQQPDLALAFQKLLTSPAEERAFALSRARAILARREEAGDDIMTWRFSSDGVRSFDVLLCMNFEGDTAAIGLDHIFDGALDWLETTVVEMARRRPGLRFAVRQHPDERRLCSLQSKKAILRLRELAALGYDVTVFEAQEDVSTYELTRFSKATVVGTSTIGIEATMLGRSVITVRRVYYASAGFVAAPTTPQSYFEALERALDGRALPSDKQIENATLMYYLLEACNRIWFELTPQISDFLRWLQRDPFEALRSETFEMVMAAVSDDKPYPFLSHDSQYKNASIMPV